MRTPLRLVLVFAVLLPGCSGWLRVPARATPSFDVADQVQVWIGNRVTVLHDVRLTRDSIIGRKDRLFCRVSPCEMALARAETDSIRRVGGTAPAMGNFAIGYAVGFGVVWLLLTGS